MFALYLKYWRISHPPIVLVSLPLFLSPPSTENNYKAVVMKGL